MGYIRTNGGNGLGNVRRSRGMGATAPSPYPYCDPNYPQACAQSKTPWASQYARDPAYPYAAGGNWGKVNYPVWAAVLANGNDGQSSNPVRNLYHLVPAGATEQGTGIPQFADLDGSAIEPAALIAKAVDAAANGEYFPWTPDLKVTKSGAPKTYPGWNFYNDNVYPGRRFDSPAEMRAAAMSSSSSSSGPPPSQMGPFTMDAATQQWYTFQALGKVPIERLPEAAMPFWRQSTYGLPPGQTVGGAGFPMVCPNNPNTGVPDPECLAVLKNNPQSNSQCGMPYNGTMPWNLYLASQAGCPNQPSQPASSAPQASTSPSTPAPALTPTAITPQTPMLQTQQQTYRTAYLGDPVPRKAQPASSQAIRATNIVQYPAQAAGAPTSGTASQSAAASQASGALDSAMAWAKDNPLILAGVAIAAFFMFSQGGKR